MGIKKSDAEFTEPFVGTREVIVMMSVQGGRSISSAVRIDYNAVHALEKAIVDYTFLADTPQTNLLVKTSHKSRESHEKDTPQTDCETCKYGEDKHRYAHICNECGVGINNYTPQTDCGWGEVTREE